MLKRRDFLRCGTALATSSPFLANLGLAAGGKKRRVLYFTRCAGFVHGPVGRPGGQADQLASSEIWMQKMADKYGFSLVISKEGNIFDGDIDQFDAFVFYTSGDLDQPIKNTEKEPASSPMTAEGKRRLLAAVEGGKGFVGIHSATDTFRTPRGEIDPYIAMLGGEFISHGKQQEANIKVASSSFPGLEGMKDFRQFEEWYSHVKLADDLHVILVQDTQGMEGWQYARPPFPATWARAHGKGRVFYTAMGHGDPIFALPIFEQVLIAGLDWATGKTRFEATPNIDQVCPGADVWPEPSAEEQQKQKQKPAGQGKKKRAAKKG